MVLLQPMHIHKHQTELYSFLYREISFLLFEFLSEEDYILQNVAEIALVKTGHWNSGEMNDTIKSNMESTIFFPFLKWFSPSKWNMVEIQY